MYSGLAAQNQLMSTSRAELRAKIDIAEGQLELPSVPQIQGSIIKAVSTRLDDDELSILINLNQGREGDEYEISIQARLEGRTVNIRPEDILGMVQKRFQASQAGEQEVIWTGLLDRYYDFSGQLELIVSVEQWGKPTLPFGVDCDKMPVFGSKQKLPYYVAAGAGVISVGLSIVIGNDAQKIYDDNYLTQNFAEAAETHYLNANDKRHTALLLRYVGIGFLAADAAAFFYRKSRHKKKLATYQEFCGSLPISVTPVFEQTSIALAGSQLGLRISHRL
jgi:hypothetical protein